MIRRMAAALALAAGLLLVPAPAHAGPAEDIASLVNQARWSNGQAGLLRNAAMDQVAANWAAQMAASGTMSHNPNYASEIPAGWSAAAENVAQGYGSGAAMHDGWMGSSGHRANILGDYTDIGIAFLSSGGTTWGVQVFAKYAGHVGPAAPAPPAAEAAPAALAEPEAVATPTPTPTPSPTTTRTRAATPEPRTTEAPQDAAAADSPWATIVGGILVVGGAGAYLVYRFRRSARDGQRFER